MKKRLRWIACLAIAYLLLVWLLALVESARGASIHGFWDALWYSLVTISTVGYGDLAPVSVPGRLIGLVFVLCSVGLLSAMIGLGLRFIGGRLIPCLRLRLNRSRDWYAFSACNADAEALAAALCREKPDCLLILPEDGACGAPAENAVRLNTDAAELIRLRKSTQGLNLFFLSDDPCENYTLACAAAERGARACCMGDLSPDALPERVQLFSVTEAVTRRYWDKHPLLEAERCVVLIGCGQLGTALLERALLNNVFLSERAIEYHVFGETQRFAELHPETVKALSGAAGESDRLFLHAESWTAARELIARADRIILCADADRENLAVCGLLEGWYVSRAALHVRLNTPLPGFCCFGERADTLTPEYVMKDELNRHAMLMNDIYNEGSPNPTPWRALSPFLQQSSIAAADHLLVKARFLLDDEKLTSLSDTDITRAYARYRALYPGLAESFRDMEHRRWLRFYQMYNWQYAPARDNARRLHPLMLPYEQLSEAERSKDDYAWEMLGRLADNA